MTKARRLRLYGPKSRLERFLTWKKGPLTTERIAIFLIIALCYINAQMILAIYNENNYIEQEENLPHIDLGFDVNPIAQHEADQQAGKVNSAPEVQAAGPPVLSDEIATHVEGDVVITDLCPTLVQCPENHVHIYAESGPRKAKVCLNGKEVLPAWKTGRGINLVVINSERATAGSVHSFDTYQNPGTDMVDILKNLNDDRFVVMVAQDEASTALNNEAKLTIEKLGSTLIYDLGWRNSWVFIGQVGITSISPYEAMKSSLDSSSWPDPVAISQCIPIKIDDEEVLAASHKEFCATYDNYGEFCKKTWAIPHPVANTGGQFVTSTFPIAIIAGDRGSYLRQVLSGFFKAPGFISENVIVFQDGYDLETFAVARQFGIRLVRFPKTDSKNHKEDTFNQADHIATNYKRSLDVLWAMHPDKEFVFIMEDDLIVSPDFFDYFNQLVPVLRSDKTLFSASAWNDNGYGHSAKDSTMIYRTDFFPGLGWLLSRKFWLEVVEPSWPKCCQGYSWDLFMRDVLKGRGLDTLYPDVSRTYHIGKTGANVHNEFFNGYFREHVLAKDSHYQIQGLDKLGPKTYSELLSDLISRAKPVDHTDNPCDQHFITEGEDLLVLYYYQRDSRETKQALAVAGCLNLWNVDKVRGMFNGVLRTHFRGNRLLIVGSMTKYGKQFMPKEIQPIRIAKYKDEIDNGQ